jgi:hypothetical protein
MKPSDQAMIDDQQGRERSASTNLFLDLTSPVLTRHLHIIIININSSPHPLTTLHYSPLLDRSKARLLSNTLVFKSHRIVSTRFSLPSSSPFFHDMSFWSILLYFSIPTALVLLAIILFAHGALQRLNDFVMLVVGRIIFARFNLLPFPLILGVLAVHVFTAVVVGTNVYNCMAHIAHITPRACLPLDLVHYGTIERNPGMQTRTQALAAQFVQVDHPTAEDAKRIYETIPADHYFRTTPDYQWLESKKQKKR